MCIMTVVDGYGYEKEMSVVIMLNNSFVNQLEVTSMKTLAALLFLNSGHFIVARLLCHLCLCMCTT